MWKTAKLIMTQQLAFVTLLSIITVRFIGKTQAVPSHVLNYLETKVETGEAQGGPFS
jgi:hypothetical protein